MTPQIMPQDLDAAPEAWARVRNALLGQLGQDAFQNWIDPLVFVGCDHGVVHLTAPTSFIGTWVSRNYGDTIRHLLCKNGVAVSRLEFSVAPRHDGERPAGAPRVRVAADARPAAIPPDVDLPASPLDGRCTFENFVVGKPNELAHAAARGVAEGVAEGGPVNFNPLFLYGGVGLGKTHLMHAIAWEVRQSNREARVLYLSAEQFMYRFVSALRFKDMHGFKEMFRSVDMLMVDDVQFISGKDSTQEEFFHTFNALIEQQKQIVISADRAPGRDRRPRGAHPLPPAVGPRRRPPPHRLRAPPRHPAGQGRGAAGEEPGRRDRRRRHGVPRPPHQLERPRARRRAQPPLRLREPRRPHHRPRHDPGVPRRHPARLRAQGDDRRDPAQGRRPLQPPDVRPALRPPRPPGRPPAAGGDVPRQDPDLASACPTSAAASAAATTPR